MILLFDIFFFFIFKNSVTEDRLYQHMALTSSAFAFSWSKWNNQVKDDEQIIIQAAQQLEDEALLEVKSNFFFNNIMLFFLLLN